MSDRRDITLEIGEQEFTFTLAPQDVTKYFNAITANNKNIENRQLPKFTYLVIEDSLSVWYRQYLKYDKDNVENGETKNVVNIQYNGNGFR